MSDTPGPDLSLIGHQLKQLLTDVGGLRDDITVLTAITMRLDGTQTALLTEVRAIHSQHSRLANRVRALETQSDA
ncbi:hypothetical protein [Rhodopila sp.]|uniref:hypothetical protein n=1 Tax=Rhodopila sp. TaxID=2480087 RepID=UPI003D122358